MNRILHKLQNRTMRKNRIRSTISGTTERPRLTVFISNVHVTAQIIDDTTHKTLAYVTTVGQKKVNGSLTDKAAWVGAEVAKKAQAAQVSSVVFDRNGRIFHGRVKALADAARKEGLEF